MLNYRQKKYDRCKYVCTKKGTLRAHFHRNHKQLEETTLECSSCDNTCTKKDTLRMHKGVKVISKNGYTKGWVYQRTKYPDPKNLQGNSASCVTSPAYYWWPQVSSKCWTFRTRRSFKSLSLLCVIKQLQQITPSVNTELESIVFLTRLMKKHCYSLNSASFHFLKKAFLLSICTENMIVLSPSQIMSGTYAITPSQ